MPTRNYLVVLRSAPGTHQRPSTEQMQEIYAAFRAWSAKYKASIVDMGGKLKPGGKTVTSSGVTDGPFTHSKEIIGGYMVVAADNIDQAIEIARACPGVIRPGTSVEIREIADS